MADQFPAHLSPLPMDPNRRIVDWNRVRQELMNTYASQADARNPGQLAEVEKRVDAILDKLRSDYAMIVIG